MRTNVIFIPNILDRQDPDRSAGFKYSIRSWRFWADAHGCILVEWNQPVYDLTEMNSCWQRYFLFDVLDELGVSDYDRILLVDADTVVNPNAPNIFDHSGNQYAAVVNTGAFEWTCRSIDLYQQLFPETRLRPFEYVNAGVQVFGGEHRRFMDAVREFYLKNQRALLALQEHRLGTDNTPLNFLLKECRVETTHLNIAWNVHQPFDHGLLKYDRRQRMADDLQNLIRSGYIYHLNAPRWGDLKRNRAYWLERVYRELYVKPGLVPDETPCE